MLCFWFFAPGRKTAILFRIPLASMSHVTPKLNAFPVFMRVEGEAVAIVGGGDEALAKARLIGQSDRKSVV